MRATLLAAASLMLLAACGQTTVSTPAEAPATPGATAAAAAGCTGTAELPWPAAQLMIAGNLAGAACPEAVATLEIRNATGAVLHTFSAPISQITIAFNPRADQTTMQSDLASWLSSNAFRTADALPAWPANASAPPVTFVPAVDRAAYEAARAARRPLYCYPDNGESAACVAFDSATGAVTKLGVERPEAGR